MKNIMQCCKHKNELKVVVKVILVLLFSYDVVQIFQQQ